MSDAPELNPAPEIKPEEREAMKAAQRAAQGARKEARAERNEEDAAKARAFLENGQLPDLTTLERWGKISPALVLGNPNVPEAMKLKIAQQAAVDQPEVVLSCRNLLGAQAASLLPEALGNLAIKNFGLAQAWGIALKIPLDLDSIWNE